MLRHGEQSTHLACVGPIFFNPTYPRLTTSRLHTYTAGTRCHVPLEFAWVVCETSKCAAQGPTRPGVVHGDAGRTTAASQGGSSWFGRCQGDVVLATDSAVVDRCPSLYPLSPDYPAGSQTSRDLWPGSSTCPLRGYRKGHVCPELFSKSHVSSGTRGRL